MGIDPDASCSPCNPPPPKEIRCPPHAPTCTPAECTPKDPRPVCRFKPIMKGMHMAQTMSNIKTALTISALAGFSYYVFVARKRIKTYKEYHATEMLDEWEQDMALRYMFSSVPPEGFPEKKEAK